MCPLTPPQPSCNQNGHVHVRHMLSDGTRGIWRQANGTVAMLTCAWNKKYPLLMIQQFEQVFEADFVGVSATALTALLDIANDEGELKPRARSTSSTSSDSVDDLEDNSCACCM